MISFDWSSDEDSLFNPSLEPEEETEDDNRKWEQALMLSKLDLQEVPECYFENNLHFLSIIVLSKNNISTIPSIIGACEGLQRLDFSSNQLTQIPTEILLLPRLKFLDLSSNKLDEKSLALSASADYAAIGLKLKVLLLSNNRFSLWPTWVLKLESLKRLHFGANYLRIVPSDIHCLKNLKDLYLGGNKLTEIPENIRLMSNLQKLSVSDNQLLVIPESLSELCDLKSLMLHGNKLKVLPQTLVNLEKLEELSLRGNPLVDRFVKSIECYSLPSLKELCSRFVINNKMKFQPHELPETLIQFLKSSQRCVNPDCSGVYFTSRVEHVKFVDFCGRFRVPLLMYLCSPNCNYESAESSSESDSDTSLGVSPMQMRRVLLG